MNEAQRKILEKNKNRVAREAGDMAVPAQAPLQAEAQPVESQRFRTAMQGLTLGFADEIEAFVRSIPDERGYQEIRDDLRQKLTAYKEANPAESITIETVGALAPAAFMLLTGFGAPGAAGTIARVAGGRIPGNIVARQVPGAVTAAVGYSEADPLSAEGMRDIASDAALGVVGGAAVEKGIGAAGGAFAQVLKSAGERFGVAGETAVQRELQSIAQSTGKSYDEIIADVEAGMPMTENLTLINTIKARARQPGPVRQTAMDLAAGRSERTREEAMGGLRGALTPEAEDVNVVRSRDAMEQAQRGAERAEYATAFQGQLVESQSTLDALMNVLRSEPRALAAIEDEYRRKGLVPLTKTDPNGRIEYARQPTVQDADIARRVVRDYAQELMIGQQSTAGSTVKGLEQQLKRPLFEESPDLATAAGNAEQRRRQADAFKKGSQSITAMRPDEIEFMFESMNPGEQDAFRAAIMNNINNLVRRNDSAFIRMAKEDTSVNDILRVVLPENQRAAALQAIDRAAASSEVRKAVDPRTGSPTQPLQVEAGEIGRGLGAALDAADAISGGARGAYSALRTMLRMVPSSRELSDVEQEEVVKLLFSEDSQLVEAALTDSKARQDLLRRAEQISSRFATLGRAAARPAQAQAAQLEVGE